MATSTRSTARGRGGQSEEADSRERTEGADSRPRGAGEPAATSEEGGQPSTRSTADPARSIREDDDGEAEFAAEEDELEYYAGLEQDQLEDRLTKLRSQANRKRKERELVQLRKELRGELVASPRVTGDTAESWEPALKKSRTSREDLSQIGKRFMKPAEPIYYHGRNIKELEEFLIFWVIHWEAYPSESELTRVRTAAAYLRDTPMKMWGQRIQSGADPIVTWEEFKRWLRDSLKAPNQRILESTLALKEMRQRDNQSCKDLYIYMCELENNIPTMNEDQRRAWTLINALRPDLRSRVVRDLQVIEDVDAVMACAGRNESTLAEGSHAKSARRPEQREAKAGSSESLPFRRRFDRGPRGNPRGRGKAIEGRSPSNLAAQTSASRPLGACWNCGKEGHRNSDCPEERKSKNT